MTIKPLHLEHILSNTYNRVLLSSQLFAFLIGVITLSPLLIIASSVFTFSVVYERQYNISRRTMEWICNATIILYVIQILISFG